MARIRPALLWRTLCVLVVALPSTVPAADSVAVFHEILYHPADGGSEWIELRNQLAVDLDISAWSLADGVRYTLPEGTVFPAGGLLVIAENPAAVPGALGSWDGRLDNSGETLTLRDRDGRIMDHMSWANQGDWPVAANGFDDQW